MALLKDLIEKPITGEWGTDGEEINVLRTTNFTNSGVLDFTNVVKRNISKKKVEQKKLQEGDIIIEKSGGSPKQPVGRVVFYDVEGVYLCNNFTSILRPKKEKVVPKYLHYLLYASHRFGVTGMFQNKTTGIINLQLPRYINKLKIPLPSLKTQQRIAGILDDAAALRDKTAQLLTEYDLLAESIFLEMFGDTKFNPLKWSIANLEDVCLEIIDCPHSTPKYVKNETEYPCIRTTELVKGDISWTKMKYLDEEGYNLRIKRLKPLEGDIVYGREGSFGEAALIPKNTKMSLGQRVMLFRVDDSKISNVFLHRVLRTKGLYHQALRVTAGSTVGHVNVKDIKKFKIIVPPIELQNQFTEKIALIEQQKSLAKQELQESEDLFNCLLQKAFKGDF